MPFFPPVSVTISHRPQFASHRPQFANLPGGLFVMGSAFYKDTQPQWVHVSPFRLAEVCTTEGEYRDVMGRPGRKGAPDNHPVTEVSWNKAVSYLSQLGRSLNLRVGLPTEAEWEFAARGPAVNLHEIMEAEGVAAGDFADWSRDRFENFVERLEMGTRIFTNPTDRELRKILKSKNSLYAWRVHGTPSGRLTDEEAWHSVNEERKGPQAVDWGPVNGYGLKQMTAGVWEWVGDWYQSNDDLNLGIKDPMGPKTGDHRCLRGGSWYDYIPDLLRAACNVDHTGRRDGCIGFRVAAAALQDS